LAAAHLEAQVVEQLAEVVFLLVQWECRLPSRASHQMALLKGEFEQRAAHYS
jgi:hypothetical protein